MKRTLTTSILTGLMILGAGSMVWAIYNIREETDYAALPAYTESSSGTQSTQGTLEPSGKAGDSLSPAGETTSSVTPAPEETLYLLRPFAGDIIGSLTLPALNMVLPIIEGTGEEELKKGVGHFIQSALPGENSNCVLSGHRTTVFAELGKLKIGDQVIVQTSAGTFLYEIVSFRIVHKDDTTVIVPADHAVLTLTTCYPFLFVGFAPDRYIVRAEQVTEDK